MMEQRDSDTPRTHLASEEAAEWFILTKDQRPLPASRRRQYVHWLKRSPENVAEALAVNDVYRLLRTVKLQDVPWPEAAGANVVALPARAPSPTAVRRSPGRVATWKVAAACAACTFAGLLSWGYKGVWVDPTLETQVGMWRTVQLDDGSTVQLGPRTQLRVQFDTDRRLVRLLAGEAVFSVAKDARRPFIVSNQLGSARAVGTRFGVASRGDRLVVTVAEGVVTVSRPDGQVPHLSPPAARTGAVSANGMLATLAANQQVTIASAGLEPTQRVDAESELAWAQQLLVFDNKTVGEVVAELNRRNRMQVDITDRSLAAYSVGGVFNAADPESFCEFLASVLPIVIARDEPHALRLHLATASPPAAR